MINILIKELFGNDAINREHGLRLRLLLEANWDKTDFFSIDFGGLKISSVSFFDEAFAKLAKNYSLQQIKDKIKIQTIDDFDRELLNGVLLNRNARLNQERNPQ